MSGVKMTELHPRLFMRGHTRTVDPETMLSAIQDRGIQFVLNVAIITDHWLQNAVRLVGIEYLHRPMSDGKSVDDVMVRELADMVASRMQNAGVLVHCDSGRNRSALVVIPALAIVTGEHPQKLLNDVRKLRKLSPPVLDNDVFRQYVLSFTGPWHGEE